MSINLSKGQRISLKKEAPKLEQLMCGLGWDVAKSKGGFLGGLFTKDFDLDASVICLNKKGKMTSSDDLVYFGNLRHFSSAITHMGDNLTGKGDGDDEQILVNLATIPDNIKSLVFVVNIYDSLDRKQDFSKVSNAFVRLVNCQTNKEIARYSLSGDDYQNQTGMIMAQINRLDSGDWEVCAKGDGIKINNLSQIAQLYA